MDENSRTPTGWHYEGQDTATEPNQTTLGVLGLGIGAIMMAALAIVCATVVLVPLR